MTLEDIATKLAQRSVPTRLIITREHHRWVARLYEDGQLRRLMATAEGGDLARAVGAVLWPEGGTP